MAGVDGAVVISRSRSAGQGQKVFLVHTPMRVSQIVRGQRAVTADTALRLSRYFGTRPDWWLDVQSHYDLEIAADKREARITREVKPRALRPNSEVALVRRDTRLQCGS
jgi:plasmid maintenance system antidote protein VapI